ncbi:MAG: baseplate J/gp47 family protein [Candidatus Caldarchaeum sp.]
MLIDLPKINDIPNDVMDEAIKRVRGYVQELLGDDIDLSSGPIFDLLVKPLAVTLASISTSLSYAYSYMTPDSILSSKQIPESEKKKALDFVGSYFGINRKEGSKARGRLVLFASKSDSLYIPAGSVWVCKSTSDRYISTTQVQIKPPGLSSYNPGDVVWEVAGPGLFFSTVDVEAESIGSKYNVSDGAEFESYPSQLPNITSIISSPGIFGGSDEESNESYAFRIKSATSIRTIGSYSSLKSYLLSQFPEINPKNGIFIARFGDKEMIRDSVATIWPGSFGNKIDLFVKTSDEIKIVRKRVTATLISKSGATGTWSASIPTSLAAGYYKVDYITLANRAYPRFYPITETKLVDSDLCSEYGIQPPPEQVYFAFSSVQSGSVEFVDIITDATSLTVGVSTNQYDVYLQMLPNIDLIQKEISRKENSPIPINIDFMVRAFVPAITSVSIYVSATSVPSSNLKKFVLEAISNLDGGNKLSSSYISAYVAANSDIDMHKLGVESMSITCTILLPSGGSLVIPPSDHITIPDLREHLVTSNTVRFFSYQDSISVNII